MATTQDYMNDYSLFMQEISSPNDKPTNYMQYPDDPMYTYITQLEKINLDQEREKDIREGRGFICSAARGIKKDLKDPNGIFSSKFGQTLGDQNPFIDRYKCECGRLHSRINNGLYCSVCHTRVKYMDDDFGYFGWLVLDEYYVIHPVLYMQIEFLFGSGAGKKSKLDNIINAQGEKDRDGNVTELQDKPKNEPYYGIGMIEFVERFDEILTYYARLNPAKREYYDQIVEDRDKVFTHSIPVFTTHLRPFQVTGKSMQYEGTNGIYNMMNSIVHSINKKNTRFDRNKEQKDQNLYKLQMKYMELYNEIISILEGKRGIFRNLVSGRYNFTGRSVIIQDPDLEIDQVILPYYELVIVLEQRIINIIRRSYNVSYDEAYGIWYRASLKIDPRVKEIIQSIIDNSNNGRGIAVLVNRNPTLGYGLSKIGPVTQQCVA
jgi:DNA-directed RNA polymerase beta' subunit